MKKILFTLLFAVSINSFAAQPSMSLACGKSPGYKPNIERKFIPDIYNIDVTFISKRPPNKLIDKILRNCIAASIKLDNKKNILANAWFRPIAGSDSADDEKIDPYGDFKYISYTASKNSIDVHDLTLELKK